MLASQLPIDAAVWREERPNWTQQDELLARLIETTDFWGRQHAILLGAKKNKLPRAERVEHPDRRRSAPPKEIAKPTKDPNRIARFFGIRPKGGEE